MDFAQLTALSAVSNEFDSATKYPITASPTNFKTYP